MSFLNITDARKRDAIVAEYLATRKKIKTNDYNERTRDFSQQQAIKQTLDPVVQSTNASTEAITKQLIPIEKGIMSINNKMQKEDKMIKEEKKEKPIIKHESESESESESEEEASNSEDEEKKPNGWELITYGEQKDKIDNYFGIVRRKNKYKMGHKDIEMEGNNFRVDTTLYRGTHGLWTLIMYRKPKEDAYTEDDMKVYEKLVNQTNVMHAPNNVRTDSKIRGTYKWRKIFPIFFQKQGEGIEFLPSDIKSLQSKLSYLLAEFQAGNKSATRNKIIAIADNLLERKSISREKYFNLMHYL